jgi:hypothetical protein
MFNWQVASRKQLGLEIAAVSQVHRKGAIWLVPSRSSGKRYGGQERPSLSVRSTPAGRRIRKGRASARFNEPLSRIERTS